MTVSTRILTFAASPVQFPMPPGGDEMVARIMAEPLRTNTHVCYIGIMSVTNDGSGTGVIQEVASQPSATSSCDRWNAEDGSGENTVDPIAFYAHGTIGEKLKVTYYQR